ncbi:hypothetical protein J4211_03050 [Candidatus Woesearchaeota archaeon]|nr:hypothetical protein [Candidatus Woesearchaeota archaeon]
MSLSSKPLFEKLGGRQTALFYRELYNSAVEGKITFEEMAVTMNKVSCAHPQKNWTQKDADELKESFHNTLFITIANKEIELAETKATLCEVIQHLHRSMAEALVWATRDIDAITPEMRKFDAQLQNVQVNSYKLIGMFEEEIMKIETEETQG